MWHSLRWRCAAASLLLLAELAQARVATRAVPPHDTPAPYHAGIELDDYWVRERLQGVPAHWNGERLLDTHGNTMTVPEGFTRGFPEVPVKGELWLGRGSYGHLLAVIHRRVPDPAQWRTLRFMAQDLPAHPGPFDRRLQALRELARHLQDAPHFRLAPHARIRSHDALQQQLRLILKAGGAGLILHRGSALYGKPGDDDLLMMRPYRRGHGQVVAVIHPPGNNDGLMSGLLLRSEGGRRFRLMDGFSMAQRRNPPPLGSIVEYRFYGYSPEGEPRFMSFLRVRQEGSGVIR